jgi:hypothetical protein
MMMMVCHSKENIMGENFIINKMRLDKMYRERKSAIGILVFQSLLFVLDVGIFAINIIQENILGLAISSVFVGFLIPIIVLQSINIWLCTKNITNEKFRQDMLEALMKCGVNITATLPDGFRYKEMENPKDKKN